MLAGTWGHEVALLEGSAQFFDALAREIERAEREVWLETYIFDVTGSGAGVAEALEKAARRGLRVRLVIDGFGTAQLSAEWQRRFGEAGVAWHVFSPTPTIELLLPKRWRRMHRKLCLIDGRVVFCGGINVLDDLHDPNWGALEAPRFDFAVRVTGPLVGEATESMAQLWRQTATGGHMRRGEFGQAMQTLRSKAKNVANQGGEASAAAREALSQVGQPHGARAALLLRDNFRNRTAIEKAYRRAIGLARDEIIIANAYFVPGRKLRHALVHAALRGVRVRLLLQGRYEYFMQYHASRTVYGILLAAGVEIVEYEASFLHAKVATIDGHWATVGSSNLDPLSLLLAREANVVVEDKAFAEALRARLVAAIEHGGKRVDPQAYAHRPIVQRGLDMLALGVMRFGLLLVGKRY